MDFVYLYFLIFIILPCFDAGIFVGLAIRSTIAYPDPILLLPLQSRERYRTRPILIRVTCDNTENLIGIDLFNPSNPVIVSYPPPSPSKQGKVLHKACFDFRYFTTNENPVYLKSILKIVFKNRVPKKRPSNLEGLIILQKTIIAQTTNYR